MMDNDTREKSIEYIRSLAEIESAMEPYKEQIRELREDFKSQGWLTREQISIAVKAYRLAKSSRESLDEIMEIAENLIGKDK